MSKHLKDTERLRKIVESFPKVTVTVLGDLVADEFIFGEISRVSREAPVLILKHRERSVMPGGGANAVSNLADLGVNVLPVGVVGDDEAGRLLLKAFRHKHVPVSGVLKDKSYTTVTKTRILAGMAHTARQQVVRVDREPEAEPNRHLKRELVLAAREYARASDVLLISDYGYGAATPAILNAVRYKGGLHGVPVVLDSRYRMLQYSGVTAATPNEPEVEEALGVRIGHDWRTLVRRRRTSHVANEAAVAGDHARARWHGRIHPPPEACRHPDFRVRPGGGRYRRRRHRDRHVHRRPRRRSQRRRRGPPGELRGRHRGHEARDGNRIAAGIVAGAGPGAAGTASSLISGSGPRMVRRQHSGKNDRTQNFQSRRIATAGGGMAPGG